MSDTILQSNDVMDSRRGDIVVGVDGSDESFAALRWALGEASLTGQQVNAVYAWTHSWDMGSQPEDEEQWAQMRHDIARRLREWVAQASQGMTIDENRRQTHLRQSHRNGSASGNRQGRPTDRRRTSFAWTRGTMVSGIAFRFSCRGGEGARHRGAYPR